MANPNSLVTSNDIVSDLIASDNLTTCDIQHSLLCDDTQKESCDHTLVEYDFGDQIVNECELEKLQISLCHWLEIMNLKVFPWMLAMKLNLFFL